MITQWKHLWMYDYMDFDCIVSERNSRGFVGDELSLNDIVYVGSCDITGVRKDPFELRWSDILSKKLNTKNISIGGPSVGIGTMLGYFASYLKEFGSPQTVIFTVQQHYTAVYKNNKWEEVIIGDYGTSCKEHNLLEVGGQSIERVKYYHYHKIISSDLFESAKIQIEKMASKLTDIEFLTTRFCLIMEQLLELKRHYGFELICAPSSSQPVMPFLRPFYENAINRMNIQHMFLPYIKAKDINPDFSPGPQTQQLLAESFLTRYWQLKHGK